MFRFVIILALIFSLNKVLAEAPLTCQYHIKKAHLEWVGFKTTDKTPVRGTFKKIKYESKKASQPWDVIRKAKFTIDASHVASGDSLRDKRLTEKFFKLMLGNISGKVTEVKGQQQGTIQLALTINGETRPLFLKFKLNRDLELKAQGQLDILNFKGNKALEALNQACAGLHKGKDGVSKTWSDVGIEVKIELEKSCKSLRDA